MSDVTEGSQAPWGYGTPAAVGHRLDWETADKEERPDWRAPESVERLEEWQRCRDAFEGTSALIANARPTSRSTPSNTSRTIAPARALRRVQHVRCGDRWAGGARVCQGSHVREDIHPTIIEHAENIDGAGTTLHNFAQELTEDGLTVGTSGFMVIIRRVTGRDGAR